MRQPEIQGEWREEGDGLNCSYRGSQTCSFSSSGESTFDTDSFRDWLPPSHTHACTCVCMEGPCRTDHMHKRHTHTHTQSHLVLLLMCRDKQKKGKVIPHDSVCLCLGGSQHGETCFSHINFLFFLPPHHFLFSLQISLTHIAFCYIRLHCHNTHRSFKHAHTNIKSGVGLEPLHRFMFLLRHFFTILAFVWHSSFDYGRTGNVLIYCKSKPALECDKIAIINMGFYILTFSGKGKKKF